MSDRAKILILRFSSIGDIVLTTPVIRCLHEQKNARIHFLTKSAYAPIVSANPNVEKVWSFTQKLEEVLQDLKEEDFDYIVDLHKNIRTTRVNLALKKPTLSFEKLNWQKWLMVNTKINFLPDVNIVDRYLGAVKELGVVNDGKGLDYFIPKEDKIKLKQLLPKGVSTYAALVIGAAHATKRMPVEKWIELCDQLPGTLVLIGGPDDREVAETIVEKSEASIINTCGQLSIHQSASIIQQAQQVITHDTGMMHIAAAFQKPILSIWGNTIPAFGMYPYYPKDMDRNISFEAEDLACRPCSKIGFEECPKDHFDCMNQIDIKAISQQFKRIR